MKFAVYGDGEAPAAFKPRMAKAYCDGRLAEINGELISTNPFVLGVETENKDAWDKGFLASQNGETAKQTYCAV